MPWANAFGERNAGRTFEANDNCEHRMVLYMLDSRNLFRSRIIFLGLRYLDGLTLYGRVYNIHTEPENR